MSQGETGLQIRRNISVHDRLARKYERLHGEIFNPIEQARLGTLLVRAAAEVRTGATPLRALDMGCGSGNLTGHLLKLGMQVTAADVSGGFLRLVRERYSSKPVRTHQLNGIDLSGLADESFDIVATYSVLHHIPDYLAACAEMARKCRKGGVILIDHEATPNVWTGDAILLEFKRRALRFDWRKYLRPSNYLHRLRRFVEPRYSNEGDLHVWPDDHIEWDQIAEVMDRGGCVPIMTEDYLLYRRLYRQSVYDRYKHRCADTRAMLFRRER
jgi:2-polyprenyl-3-methyl-5-hydroxy-6-metoxy-1,4-benzoquinol methylase